MLTYLICFQVLLLSYAVIDWWVDHSDHQQMLRARRALDAGVPLGKFFATEARKAWPALVLMLASYGALLRYFPVDADSMPESLCAAIVSVATICSVYLVGSFLGLYAIDSLRTLCGAWTLLKQWKQPLSSVLSACSELESLVAEYPALDLLPSTARPLLVLDFELAKSLVEKEKQRINQQASAERAAQQPGKDKLACAKLHSILSHN